MLLDGADSRPLSPGGGRRHFRQFCHCNCTCIHQCHHKQEECAHDPYRLHSPKHHLHEHQQQLQPNGHASEGSINGDGETLSGALSFPSTDSLASLLLEMESGRMSLETPGSACSLNNHGNGGRRRLLSDFAIERDLGEGAYAFVKQGRLRSAPSDSPSMAIKMIIKSKLLPECILHDFDSGLSLPVELYALRHLREYPHRNIVSMVDAFEDSLYYYLLMPMHGRGQDLFEYIERHVDFIPAEKVGIIFSQIVMAVAHLHLTLGLVHRDIKDENIIIDDSDQIQLIDFGSCAYYRRGGPNVQRDIPITEADVRSGRRMLRFRRFHGTMDYAPPEVVREEPYDGPQQDIWALGVLLYTLTFKEFPFRSPLDILEHRLRMPFAPLPEIASLIDELLEGEPERRPTAAQLVSNPWILENYQKALDRSSSSNITM